MDLADTPEKRFQGLSGREILEEGTGMLFVFQEERQHTFWMKDMRFPLDMIWITAECTGGTYASEELARSNLPLTPSGLFESLKEAVVGLLQLLSDE